MALQISPTVTAFLKSNPEKKFTAREIADWIRLHHAQACEQKLSQSKNKRLEEAANEQDRIAVLIQILVAEIGSQRPNIQKKTPQIKITDSRPRKYYYTDKTDDAEVEAIENKQVTSDSLPLEHDLYPMLVEYLKAEHGLYAKRIDEKRSTNNRGAKGKESMGSVSIETKTLLL